MKTSPLVMLDPTQPMIKNITENCYQIVGIQANFVSAFAYIADIKQKFFDELNKEIREQGGVKKDYFLSYHKKKDRALDISKNIVEDILRPRTLLLNGP